MTVITYAFGCARLQANWTAEQYDVALLVPAFVPDPAAQVWADDVTASELTDASYSRATLTGAASGPGAFNSVDYAADPADFGAPAGGETAGWAALIEVVSNDADSPIVAVYPIARTLDGTALEVTPPAAGWVSLQGTQ